MHDNISLILDIGNGSVGAMVLNYEHSAHGSIPTVLYCHREPLTFLPDMKEKRLLAAMLDLLKTTLQHVQKEAASVIPRSIWGGAHFSHVVCIFSSPWYASQASVVRKEATTPFHITNPLVNELVNKEEVRFAEALTRGDYEQHFGTKVVLLERALVHSAINGYEVTNPVGKFGRLLEITLFTSLISEKVLRLVEDVFYHVFHIRQIECFSYALASWNAIRTMFPEASDFIFLDVGGETSDVTITIRGAITETLSFPFGRSTILRTLVEVLHISPENAVSFMKMRSLGTLEKEIASDVEKVLATVADQWTDAFNQTLSSISKKYNLPKQAFVTIDPDFASFFNGILSRADIGPALFKGPFTVVSIANNTIASFVRNLNQSNTFSSKKSEALLPPKFLPGIADPALAIEAVFFSNKV